MTRSNVFGNISVSSLKITMTHAQSIGNAGSDEKLNPIMFFEPRNDSVMKSLIIAIAGEASNSPTRGSRNKTQVTGSN